MAIPRGGYDLRPVVRELIADGKRVAKVQEVQVQEQDRCCDLDLEADKDTPLPS